MINPASKKRILILGGGFAGAYTAKHLERRLGRSSDFEVVLVAKENFTLFTPMLHEVAGADLAVTDIVQPLRKVLRHTRVAIAEIEAIDLVRKVVRVRHVGLDRAFDVTYDQLVVAVGAITNFYRIPGLEEHALTMKTLGDAILVRNRVIDALGVTDNQVDDADRRVTLTVVVAGGGFAGVETAGAVNGLLHEALKFYPTLHKKLVRVVIVHPGEVILPELSASLGRYAQSKLGHSGVEVRLKTKVTGYDGKEVTLDDGTTIPTRMLIWTAGITPPPLLSNLACAKHGGRIVTDACFQVPEWPGVWTLGDCALVPDVLNPGKFHPPTAQHAIREAKVLASNIVATLRGEPLRPFKFKIIGMLATVGRRRGVAEIFGWRFSGIVAWWLWRGIYLSKLPGVQKKVRVALDWMLDVVFSKDIVQLPTLAAPTMSHAEEPSAGAAIEQATSKD
jgi:NADH:ubiquinone reductase (H+-translocating)